MECAAARFIKTSMGEKIVDSWDECVKFRDMVPSNAKYKKFARIEDAQKFLGEAGAKPAASSTDAAPVRKPVPNYNWVCPHVIAYTDGSFNADNGHWGYGVSIQDEKGTELAAYSGNGTEYASSRNITGEVHGAIRAIQAAIRQGCTSILIVHDYEGISAWAEGKWKAKLPMPQWYRDQIAEMRSKIDISFKWVPGHNGVAGNERADQLAKDACFGINIQL